MSFSKWPMLVFLVSPLALGDVILCTGMSNARDICGDWKRNNTTGHTIVNGAEASFNIVRIFDKPEVYWDKVFSRISREGLEPADIDVIWNLNVTLAKSGNLIIERQLVHDYFIWLQSVAGYLFPNLQAGYHSPRTLGLYCKRNPEPFAGDIRNAILGAGDSSGAITHFPKWHFGPDLSTPEFLASDFTDGCHLTKSGLAKTTPIMDEFFATKNHTAGGITPAPGAAPAQGGGERAGSYKIRPVSAAAPIVTNLEGGSFKVSWRGAGSMLNCNGVKFRVEGESHVLQIPADLPFRINNRCSIDKSPMSNRFGCRSLSECRAL